MSSVMDRDKFVLKQAKGWDSVEEFLKYIAVSPCDCSKKKCKGWQVRWKFGAERRREEGNRKPPPGPSGTPGYIYFARLGDLIKIGFSQNPEARIRGFNGLLLATCEGNRELEAEFHAEFADLCERGEWFRAEPHLLQRIEELTR